MWTFQEDGTIEPLMKIPGIDEPFNLPRQELPEVWWHIGLLDIVRTAVVKESRSLSGKNILPLKVSRSESVDIDTLEDFERASVLLKQLDCVKP